MNEEPDIRQFFAGAPYRSGTAISSGPPGPRRCGECGGENPIGSRFCNRCGAFLGADVGAVDRAARALPLTRARLSRSDVAVLAPAAMFVLVLLLFLSWLLISGNALVRLRRALDSMPAILGVVAAGVLLASFGAALWVRLERQRGVPAAWRLHGLTVLALALATMGEGQVLARQIEAGRLLYLAAGALACASAALLAHAERRDPASFGETPMLAWDSRWELPLAVLVLGVGIFARFYRLGDYPLGIEGDEAMFGRGVYAYMFHGNPDTGAGLFQYEAARGSFWVESLFFRLMGPSWFTARFMVAALSSLANVAFYFLARRTVGTPAAIIATFLLSLSIVDVSASRLGNIEAQNKLMPVLATFLCVLAVETRRPLFFFLCGLAVAGGLVSMDIFHPMSAVVALYLGVCFLRDRRNRRPYLIGGALFALAVIPAVPVALQMINLRQGFYLSNAAQAKVGFPPSLERLGRLMAYFRTNLDDLLTSLFLNQRWGDHLVNRNGPFINAVLVPFLVVGTVWALARAHERHNALLLLWFGLAFFPVSILIGAGYLRALYPAFPAIYLLTAIGIWQTFVALWSVATRPSRPKLVAGLVALLMTIGAFNMHIYAREVRDFDDRIHRRDLADAVASAVGPGRLTYVAFRPDRSDYLQVEARFIEYVAEGRIGLAKMSQHFLQLPYTELLPRISSERLRQAEVRIIAEASQADSDPKQLEVLRAVQRCFPGTKVRSTRFVSVYTIPRSALVRPACTTEAAMQLERPVDRVALTPGRVEFGGAVTLGAPSDFHLQVERMNDRILFVEAEDFSKDGGWFTETRYAGDFSGAGFLADNFRSGKSTYEIDIPAPGNYDIWVRSHRRRVDDTHVYLDAGRGPVEFARTDQSRLNRWVWESVGRYKLGAGPLRLIISKDFGTSNQYSMFIDSLYISRDPDFDPNERTIWDVVLDTGVRPLSGGRLRASSTFPKTGRYRWRARLLDGDRLVDPFGRTGVWTGYGEFRIARSPSP